MLKRVVSFLLVLLFPITLFAEDRAIVVHNGEEGYWFSKDIGDKILEDLAKYEKLQELNLELELKIDKQHKKIEKLEYIITLDKMIELEHKGIIQNKDDQLRLLTDENDKLRTDRDKWYNNKVLWFSFGFVLSSVFSIGVASYTVGR